MAGYYVLLATNFTNLFIADFGVEFEVLKFKTSDAMLFVYRRHFHLHFMDWNGWKHSKHSQIMSQKEPLKFWKHLPEKSRKLNYIGPIQFEKLFSWLFFFIRNNKQLTDFPSLHFTSFLFNSILIKSNVFVKHVIYFPFLSGIKKQ